MSIRVPLIWFLVLGLLPAGCVRRRMTVRSQPAGATVYIDDQEVGETPVSTPFVYYGTRKIQLVKDGYETMTVKQKVSPPWYQIPPLDFFTENVVPYEYRDERIVEFELEPQRVVSTPELLGRAQELRESTRAGYTVAPPPASNAIPEAPPAMAPPAMGPPAMGPGPGLPNLPPPFYPSR